MSTGEGRFGGKVAIVTGAGSGIGRATAVRLATEGATVVAADLARERLDELVAAHAGLAITPVVGDVSAQDGVDQVVAAAGGRVDVLANVAGIMDGFLPAAEVDDATWERGGRRLHRLQVRHQRPHLNTAFIYGPKGVRCNAVAPGPVATNIEAPWRSQVAAERIGPVMRATVPPVAQPEALAATICWLASDDAANVNGVVLPSEAGWSAL